MKFILRAAAGTETTSPVDLPPGVQLRQGRWIPWVGGMFTGSGWAAAVTLGDTIVVHPAAQLSERLIRHELEHVRQWREAGWTFPLRYAWLHLKHGYRANPYEVAARDAERTQT